MPFGPSFLRAPLRGGQPHKRFQQIGGSCWPLDKFAGARPHGVHDNLRLAEGSDGEHGRIGHFLMQQLNGPQGDRSVVAGNIDQDDVGSGSADAAHHWIGGSHGKAGTRVSRACHTGAVHQHLQHSALLVICGHDYN